MFYVVDMKGRVVGAAITRWEAEAKAEALNAASDWNSYRVEQD